MARGGFLDIASKPTALEKSSEFHLAHFSACRGRVQRGHVAEVCVFLPRCPVRAQHCKNFGHATDAPIRGAADGCRVDGAVWKTLRAAAQLAGGQKALPKKNLKPFRQLSFCNGILVQAVCQGSAQDWLDIKWMDEILHCFESMGNHCLLLFRGEISFQGFLGGAGPESRVQQLPSGVVLYQFTLNLYPLWATLYQPFMVPTCIRQYIYIYIIACIVWRQRYPLKGT